MDKERIRRLSKAASVRRLSDPLARAAYNASKLAYYRKIHGEFKKGQRQALRSSHHRRLLESEKQARFESRLKADYGEDALRIYLLAPFKPYTAQSKIDLDNLKRLVIFELTGIHPSESTVARVVDLNRACNLPLLHIGWHCLSCGIAHFNPRFFEIDHIVPREDGGFSKPENLQCLCPNCHKKKTLGIDGFSLRQSFKKTPAARVDVKQISGVAIVPQTQTDTLIKQSDEGTPAAADVKLVTTVSDPSDMPASALQLAML